MSSTAVAEVRTGPGIDRERDPQRGWRSHWAARLALPAIYLLATAVAIERIGLPYSQDWIFVWIVGLMLALSIGGRPAHRQAPDQGLAADHRRAARL